VQGLISVVKMLPKSNKGTEARAGIHDDQQSLQLLGNDEELSTIKNDISADAVILSLQKRLRKIYVLLAVLTMVVFLLIWINFREIEISSMTTSSGVAMFKHQELQLLNCKYC
jgi:hypothetical protein